MGGVRAVYWGANVGEEEDNSIGTGTIEGPGPGSEDWIGRKAVGETALRSLCSSSFAAARRTPQRCVSAAGFSRSISVGLVSAGEGGSDIRDCDMLGRVC
jgi:hypothetical protein